MPKSDKENIPTNQILLNEKKEKLRIYYRDYYQMNKDKKKEYNKKYYKENREKLDEYAKNYYHNNKKRCILYMKRYQEANKEKVKKYREKYYRENREKIKLGLRVYMRNNWLTTNGKRIMVRKRHFYGICELCKKNVDIRPHWHHWDDKHPEKGLWLCYSCHFYIAEPYEKYKEDLFNKIKEYKRLKECQNLIVNI